MDRRHFFGSVLGGATLGGLSLASGPASAAAGGEQGFKTIPAAERRRNRFLNVTLTTHEGQQVKFYDNLLKDKTVLLNFFYTNCVAEAICPLTTANLVEVQKLLGAQVGQEIFMYSISLDPEHDTPKVLLEYARAFQAKPGWLFLTGATMDIEAVRRNLGYVDLDPVKDRDRSQHIGMVRYGIEPLERWAGCPSLSKPRTIVDFLTRLDPTREWRGVGDSDVPPVPAAAHDHHG
jgi:protein SCO1